MAGLATTPTGGWWETVLGGQRIYHPGANESGATAAGPAPAPQPVNTGYAQAPAPTSVQAMGAPLSPYTNVYSPVTGQSTYTNTAPNVNTNQYATGAEGTAPTGGQGTLSTGSYEQQQQSQLEALLQKQRMEQAAELQKQAEARRLGYLSTITGSGGSSPTVPGQVGPAADENAARAAAFARAKEQAGATAMASVKALQDIMAGSGLTGSSVEGNALASIAGGGAGRINDFTRTQLITDLNRAADIADRNQAGLITQRGQNLSLIPSLMGLITAGTGVY